MPDKYPVCRYELEPWIASGKQRYLGMPVSELGRMYLKVLQTDGRRSVAVDHSETAQSFASVEYICKKYCL